jgi:hypothetical protein
MAKIKSTTVANDTNIFTRRITVERGPKGTGMTVTFTSSRMDRPETSTRRSRPSMSASCVPGP